MHEIIGRSLELDDRKLGAGVRKRLITERRSILLHR
jgi:hypothetical protein